MIRLEAIYWLMGLMVGGVAIVNALDGRSHTRWRNTIFWVCTR